MRARRGLPLRLLLLVGFGLGLGGLALLRVEAAPPIPTWPDAADPVLVAQGAALAAQHCAACHGADLAGQDGWQQPRADGSVAAPPLDARGNAWQRSDAALYAIIAAGPEATAQGALSPMPAYGTTLSADEIWALIAHLKSRWPDGHRAFQALLNPVPRGLPPAEGDWTFPASY